MVDVVVVRCRWYANEATQVPRRGRSGAGPVPRAPPGGAQLQQQSRRYVRPLFSVMLFNVSRTCSSCHGRVTWRLTPFLFYSLCQFLSLFCKALSNWYSTRNSLMRSMQMSQGASLRRTLKLFLQSPCQLIFFIARMQFRVLCDFQLKLVFCLFACMFADD